MGFGAILSNLYLETVFWNYESEGAFVASAVVKLY